MAVGFCRVEVINYSFKGWWSKNHIQMSPRRYIGNSKQKRLRSLAKNGRKVMGQKIQGEVRLK